MTQFEYKLHDTPLTEMKPGQEFAIPDNPPKYFQSLVFEFNGGAGEFVNKTEVLSGWGDTQDINFSRTYFHAAQPGYAAFGFAYPWGDESNYVVKVISENGAASDTTPPISRDDHMIYGLGNFSHPIGDVIGNDNVPLLDLAVNVQVRAVSSDVFVEVDTGFGSPTLDIISTQDSIQLGTKVAEYRIEDVAGNWGNWAKIYIDAIGDNSSRDHIVGNDTSEVFDFSLSNESVGVYGMGGDDVIRGSQADDRLYGGDGNDRIGGRAGNDLIDGGNGNDTLFGDAGNDTIDGGAGNDVILGGEGHDILRGGAGNDALFGDNGDDQIGGKAGDDVLHGGAGNDNIWGDNGNDILFGDAGNDSLNGGSGDDILTGGLGIDRMRGEAGSDTFVFIRGETQGDTILDFEGAGVDGGDKIEFHGYGKDASVHHVSGDTWQIDGDGISETFKIAGVSHLSALDFSFV